MTAPVAEVSPVHLRLLARGSLKTHKSALLLFPTPGPYYLLYLGVAALIAALLDLGKQTAGVVYALFPALPQIRYARQLSIFQGFGLR